MGELRWSEQGGGGQFRLTGEITEDTDFGPLLEALPTEATLLLDAVTRINSCGVREWIYFVEDAKGAGKRLVLARCAVPFVHQMNMIANFVGESRIQSVMAPFFCASCGKADAAIVDLAGDAVAQVRAPRPCPRCGAPMEFDDVEEAYFAFLAQA